MKNPHAKFMDDVFSQLDAVVVEYRAIEEEYNRASDGDALGEHTRQHIKRLLRDVKDVFDQLTFKAWEASIGPLLDEHEHQKLASRISYPYATKEADFEAAIGKMVPKPLRDQFDENDAVQFFVLTVKILQPFENDVYRAMPAICRLAIVAHRRLISRAIKINDGNRLLCQLEGEDFDALALFREAVNCLFCAAMTVGGGLGQDVSRYDKRFD
jgi:hypothetical protein